jgi:hypothetical protein
LKENQYFLNVRRTKIHPNITLIYRIPAQAEGKWMWLIFARLLMKVAASQGEESPDSIGQRSG